MRSTRQRWLSLLPLALWLAACGNETGDAPAPDTTADVIPDEGLSDVGDGGDTDLDVPFPGDVDVDLPDAALRRMSARQFRNAVRDLFSPDVVVAGAMEPEVITNGLAAIGSSLASFSPRGVEQFQSVAGNVAAQVPADPASRARYFACADAGAPNAECVPEVLDAIASRAWRRPVTDAERSRLAGVATEAINVLGSFDAGIVYGISAILQSPHFLYRNELPTAPAEGTTLLGPWQLASRLSFFLWNSIPDDELRAVAADGSILDEDVLLAQVDRMMDDGRFREGLRAFFTDLYHLDGLDRLSKDSTIFPHMGPDVGPAAREETLLFLEHIVLERDSSIADIVTLPISFVNRKLAAIYDVRAPSRDGFGQVEFTEADGRRGIMGHLSVLALHSHPVSSSATLRGRFIREVLLCGEIEPPPADVNTALPEPEGNAVTLRDRVQRHLDQSDTCSSCHLAMDPLGLALENFDSLGRWRELDNGGEIDPSGDLDGVPFNDAWDLAYVVAEHPDYARCFVTNVYRYTLGRRNTLGDRQQLVALQSWFDASGRRVQPLLRAIALSTAFRSTGPLAPNP